MKKSVLDIILEYASRIFNWLVLGEDNCIDDEFQYILDNHREELNRWQNEYREVIGFDGGWPEYRINPEKASHTFEVFGKPLTLTIEEGGSIVF